MVAFGADMDIVANVRVESGKRVHLEIGELSARYQSRGHVLEAIGEYAEDVGGRVELAPLRVVVDE